MRWLCKCQHTGSQHLYTPKFQPPLSPQFLCANLTHFPFPGVEHRGRNVDLEAPRQAAREVSHGRSHGSRKTAEFALRGSKTVLKTSLHVGQEVRTPGHPKPRISVPHHTSKHPRAATHSKAPVSPRALDIHRPPSPRITLRGTQTSQQVARTIHRFPSRTCQRAPPNANSNFGRQAIASRTHTHLLYAQTLYIQVTRGI